MDNGKSAKDINDMLRSENIDEYLLIYRMSGLTIQ